MKHFLFYISLFLISCSQTKKSEKDSPNFIFILADDLGYGELGVLGQQLIETPNLDSLAKSGMMTLQRSTSLCSCSSCFDDRSSCWSQSS